MALELNKLTAQIEEMGAVVVQRQTDYRALGQQARETLEGNPDVTDALTAKIQRARAVDSWRRGATPLGDKLLERRGAPALETGVTLIAADGSQIFPDRDGLGPYFLLNTGAIVFRRGSGQAPSVSSKPEIFYADSDIFDDNHEVRTAEYVGIKRQRREIEALADLAEAERTAAGGDLSQVIVALIDGPLLPWIRAEGADTQALQQEIEFTAGQLERLRRARAIPVGYIANPDSAYVLRILELLEIPLEAISRESLRRGRFQHLSDRALFEDLGSNERSAAFTANTDANDRYQRRADDRIAFVYTNVGRPGADREIARLEIPGWVAADPGELDKAQAAIYANCEPEGYPYVLARAHELAVVSPGERERLEEMVIGYLLRNGMLPEYSAKVRNKLLTGSRPWR